MLDSGSIVDPRSRNLKDRIDDARNGVPVRPAVDFDAEANSRFRSVVVAGTIDRIGIRRVKSGWENSNSEVTYVFTLTKDPKRVHAITQTAVSDDVALARSGDAVAFEIRHDGTVTSFRNDDLR